MYKIVGADQKEYGPATSEQVRSWIGQGRANGQTLASFEGSPLKPLSTYPEFADALRTVTPPPVGQPLYPNQTVPGAGTNTAAVTGLVFCILGTCCSPLSIIGLILCVVGLSQIQKSPHLYTTAKVLPIVGIVIGLINLVLASVVIGSGALGDALRSIRR